VNTENATHRVIAETLTYSLKMTSGEYMCVFRKYNTVNIFFVQWYIKFMFSVWLWI